jgi:hypothetical protein
MIPFSRIVEGGAEILQSLGKRSSRVRIYAETGNSFNERRRAQNDRRRQRLIRGEHSTGEYVEAVTFCSGGVIASIDACAYGVSLALRFAPSTPGCVLPSKRSDALIALLLGEMNHARQT